MVLSITATDIPVGFGNAQAYRIGEGGLAVGGALVVGFGEGGAGFAARAYADSDGLGLGDVRPYHVRDNADGTADIYYQVRDADPLPTQVSNWVVTVDAATGAGRGAARSLTEGPLARNDAAPWEAAIDLPDGRLAVLQADVTFRSMTLSVVDRDGGNATSGEPFGQQPLDLPRYTLGSYDMAVLGDTLFVTWAYGQAGSAGRVYGRAFALDGTPLGDEIEISTQTTTAFGAPIAVKVDAISGDRLAVVWTEAASEGPDTDATSVRVRVLDSEGGFLTDPILVNDEITTGRQDTPVLVPTEDGFVVGYSVLSFASPFTQEGRLKEFDSDGMEIDLVEAAYAFGGAPAIRTDKNTAFILDGTIDEIALPGEDGPLSDAGGGGGSPMPIVGTARADTLRGTARNDEIQGKGGNDTLVGRGGSDSLFGGAGRDSLTGNAGGDLLDGGAGRDLMRGGGGNDSFVFSAGRDRIRDFQDDRDTLVLDDALWRGDLTKRQIVNRFVEEGDGFLFVEIGRAVLRIDGMEDANALRNDIDIV